MRLPSNIIQSFKRRPLSAAVLMVALIAILLSACGGSSGTATTTPPTAGAAREPGISFNVNDLLPDDRTTYRYPGSLTTPPCSESVQWMRLKNPMTVSADQAQQFEDTVGYNSRYTQPLHGREILEDISAD